MEHQHENLRNPLPREHAPLNRGRRALMIAAAGSMFTRVAAQTQTHPQPGKLQTVTLGQISLSFYAVSGGVVQEVLERLGHTVVVREGPHERMFPLLDAGAIDLMAAVWLPEGHNEYWTEYGRNAQEVAELYQGARFFWAVPDYVPAPEIHSIADLARPDVMKTMNLSIQGIGPGAAITRLSEIAMDEYNLEELGYRFQPGSQGEWIAAHDAGLAERQRFIFPTWTPQYLNNGGRLRPLDDPLHVLGGENRGSLVAPQARLQMLPPRTVRVLSRIRLGIDGVTHMDWLVNVQKKTPLEAARTWMQANDALVSSWFAA